MKQETGSRKARTPQNQNVGAADAESPKPSATKVCVRTEQEETQVSIDRLGTSEAPNTVDKSDADLIAEAAAKLTITPNDTVIAVTGLTGTGNSTLIECLTQAGVKIGHNLRACTAGISVYKFVDRKGRTIFLVDTPGFDDTTRSDTEVLTDLASFLGATYSKDIMLTGIIYLHRITDNKLGGHAFRNLAMFRKLCGKDCMRKVVLATTMWDKLKDAEARREAKHREDELMHTEDWWGDMIDSGSKVFRHDRGLESALAMIDYLVGLGGDGIVADVAKEMINQGKTLEQTAVGQEVSRDLLKAKERHEKELQAVRESLEQQIKDGNEKGAAKLRKVEAALLEKEKKHKTDMEQMKKDYKKIQDDADAANKREIAKLQSEIKTFQAEAETHQQEYNKLVTKINGQETAHKNLKTTLDNADQTHREALAAQEKNWEAQRQIMLAELAQKQKHHEEALAEARKRSGAGGFLTGLGGFGLAVVGVVTLNPVLAGAGVAMASGGTAFGIHRRTN